MDLADRLEIGLTRTEALHVLYQAALGLRALHAAGVVHRDLKPANVLLTANGEVKLVDLGIALEREQSALTKTGEVLGTPDYMAPEVARGKRPTPAADVYALAATAYRLFAGRPLFELPSPIAVVHAHVKDTPPSFEDLDPPVSPGLARILDRCLAKDPAQRPDLDALLDALEPMHPTISREPHAPRTDRRVDRQPTFDRGERFHHFVLLGELGRGATSIVYEAYHLDRQERVALKTLHPERMDERGRARFLHEVSALRTARHPNTVELLEYGLHEGIHFLALELVDGKPLSRWIAETDRPLAERLEPLLLLCSAVEAAHREGWCTATSSPRTCW
ncbi:MAG: protein kinase [Planctomycetota bacterium]